MLLFFYVIQELVFPLLLATGVISTILMMNQIFEFIPFLQSTGVELGYIIRMILYSLPPIFMISVPISLMIGVYSGISRLSSDSELIVIRASGVSLSYFFRPVLLLASLVAVFVMILTFYLSPIGVKSLAELKYNILKKQTRLNLTVGQINNFFGQKLIYIFDKKEDIFQGIFISDWNLTDGSGVIEAQSGKIYLDEEMRKIVFQLYDGKIHNLIGQNGYRIVSFDRLDYDLNPPETENANIPARFRKKGDPNSSRLDTEMTSSELFKEMTVLPPDSRQYFEYSEEFHSRIVTVLSCICFAIFSLPMGIFNPRNPNAGNVVYMVFVLIIYFLIYAQIRTMVSRGEITPAALYLALVFVIINGLIKYFKINQNIDSLFQFGFSRFKRS